MIISLSEIARGRRIVAVTAREMARTRNSERPPRLGPFMRLIRLLRR